MMIGLYFVEVEASCDWLRFNLWQLLCPEGAHLVSLLATISPIRDFGSDILRKRSLIHRGINTHFRPIHS